MAEFSLDLNEDQLQLQKWVHDFAENVIRPAGAEWDEREETPWPIIEEAAKIGLYSFDFVANGSLDPTDIFVPTLRTKDRGNAAGYANPEVDKLLDAAGLETDQAKRAELYRDAQAIVNRQAPWIFLWLPQDLYGASKRLVGWQPLASGMLNLRDACVR